MAKTRTIAAIDPVTGARITRRTARTYYAAIVCTLSSGAPYAYAWAGRADLAAAQLAKYQRCCPDGDARLALVTEDSWAEATAAAAVAAEPEAAPVNGCRLAGDARHLFALFARRYSLTAPQCFALQSEALGWARRVAIWCNGQPLAGPFGALTPGLARRGVITLQGARRSWAPDALAELWAVAQAQAAAEGLRPLAAVAEACPSSALPVEARPAATPEPLAQVEIDPYRRGEWQRTGIGPDPVAVAERRAARWAERNREHSYRVVAVPARPVLPGETEPPASVAQDRPAPVLPNLPRVAPAPVAPACLAPVGTPPRDAAALARLRADATVGRRVSRPGPPAPTPDSLSPSPTGDAWAGQPWDPGTPDARARVALQGERVATLWPIAQAARGAGFDLPPVWWADGPILAGERTYGEALAALPLGAIAAAAAALAALPPVTTAQDRALRLCRGEAVGV